MYNFHKCGAAVIGQRNFDTSGANLMPTEAGQIKIRKSVPIG